MVAGPFVYQAKLRRGLPSYLREWLRGIVAAGERSDGATGVVVWKAPNARDDDAVVVLSACKDWQGLAWRVRFYKREKPAGRESRRAFRFCSRGSTPENGTNVASRAYLTSRSLRNWLPRELHKGDSR